VYQVRSSSGQEPLVACSACLRGATSAGGRIAAAVSVAGTPPSCTFGSKVGAGRTMVTIAAIVLLWLD